MLSRIHVRRDIISSDRKTGLKSNAIGVETSGMKKRYGVRVTIHGPAAIVYSPDKPLKCGARAWMETHSKVTVHRG